MPADPAEAPQAGDPRARVQALSWHHQIDLGDGLITPGRDRSARKLAELTLPPLGGETGA